MFNPWAQLMMLVFAAAGMGLAYLEAGQRKFWWAFGLKFYVLPACIWAMIGVAEFSWVPFPAGCISAKCQMAAGPARLTMVYLRLSGVLVAGLLYLVGVAALRHYWKRIVVWDINRLRNHVSLDKWYFDATTGQFYEVTARHGGAFSYTAIPWATRKMKEREAVQQRVVASVVSVICWALTLALWIFTGNGEVIWTAFLWLMVALSCGMTFISFLAGIAVRQAIKRTGPSPISPREDTSVEDQRVHDTGGMMDEDELDAALKGEVRTSKPVRPQPWSA